MYQLIQDYLYPLASSYRGNVEECTFAFSLGPEQIPGTDWFRDQLINAFTNKVQEQGARMIALRVHEDTEPLWHTDYIVVATATASPLYWAVVVVGVLAILFLFALSYTITQVRTFFWGQEGQPPAGWGSMMTMIVVVVVMGMMMNLVRES